MGEGEWQTEELVEGQGEGHEDQDELYHSSDESVSTPSIVEEGESPPEDDEQGPDRRR